MRFMMLLRRFALAALLATAAAVPAIAQDSPAQPAPQTSTPDADPGDAAPGGGTPADATAPNADDPPEQVAVPITAPTQEPIGEDADAPEILSTTPSRVVALTPHDEAAYRAAFAAIQDHDWRGVNAALARVQDDSLVETVRGRMLASSGYRASFATLNAWLARNNNLGVSQAVYQRALAARPMRGRRRHRHHVGPMPHPVAAVYKRTTPGSVGEVPGDSAAARVQINRIADLIGANDDAGARALAQQALSGPRSGQAAWELGLIAYRQHNYAEAVQDFETSAQWPYHGSWAQSAVQYWAARARLATGDHQGVKLHLETAASKPWTLYGQLAEQQLGRTSPLNFSQPTIDAAALTRFLDRHSTARRAAALAQLGRLSEVEADMRRLHGELTSSDDGMYFALAVALRAPSAQLRAAEYGGPQYAAGYCPANSFIPDNGFSLDRALIYAIVRQESYFNPAAVSVSNARGLMQLLASTARDMDGINYRRNPTLLFDPGHNLQLGQNYVEWLMSNFHADRDLGRVFASYNGGPGWLSRWLATQSDTSDPLMIMETMPRADSRDYAERVLSHMALCRKSMGQPTPELDALASGRPATYVALDRQHVAQGGVGHTPAR